MIGEYCVIRTVNAGVHVGTVVAFDDDGRVSLEHASRVWRWRGANTLHELSLRGCDEEFSRISSQVERITVLGVIEMIPCTAAARESLSRPRWGGP